MVKQDMVKTQLMNNRINELVKKDIFMETIQNVVHNNKSPEDRNKILRKKKLNLSISPKNLSEDNKNKTGY